MDRRTSCVVKRLGFSLIELLVVIVVIAILASLLLPVLAQAKAKGQSARCKGNLRQMSFALHLYLDDNKSIFPPFAVIANNAKHALYWFDHLSPYLANPKWGEGVFQCPSYRWKVFEGSHNPFDSNSSFVAGGGSYAYNLGEVPYRPWTGFLSDSDVKAPSDMYVLGDALTMKWPNGWIIGEFNYIVPRDQIAFEGEAVAKFPHSQRYNMLFLDGHVESAKTNVLLGRNPVFMRRWSCDNLSH